MQSRALPIRSRELLCNAAIKRRAHRPVVSLSTYVSIHRHIEPPASMFNENAINA
jgi:hypothetical protein